MEPLVCDGESVPVDSKASPEAGDLVVIFFRPGPGIATEDQVVLKRLVLSLGPWVKFPYRHHPKSDFVDLAVVETLSPRRSFSYKCTDLLGIHKCLGSAESLARRKFAALREALR